MKIRLEPHTLRRAKERGATEKEILETLQTGQIISAKNNRLTKSKSFSFSAEKNGKFYEEKKLEVFYTIENDEIITITVYVFFGKF
ncbi:MAG: DUF4258 domain-containing protein [Bacteroidota bacterium]|nr:DUF4258 domain-containing protein [Bacteroidota bacterium]